MGFRLIFELMPHKMVDIGCYLDIDPPDILRDKGILFYQFKNQIGACQRTPAAWVLLENGPDHFKPASQFTPHRLRVIFISGE